MRDLFYFCYKNLCRNINRIIRISPDVVSRRMFYDYLSLLEYIKNIDDSSFMLLPFRQSLSKLFTIVLDILVKCSPLYLRASYYFNYLYRVNEITESNKPNILEFVVNLTCDLNEEIKNIVINLTKNSVDAEPINFGEVVGNASLHNIEKFPHADEYTGERIIGRNVNAINYNIPIANGVLVESQPISRVGNGRTRRRPPRRPPRRARLGNNVVPTSLNENRLGNNAVPTSLNDITSLNPRRPTRLSILRNRISRRRPGARI